MPAHAGLAKDCTQIKVGQRLDLEIAALDLRLACLIFLSFFFFLLRTYQEPLPCDTLVV